MTRTHGGAGGDVDIICPPSVERVHQICFAWRKAARRRALLVAPPEAGVDGRRQHLGRHRLLDGSEDGPPAFRRYHRQGRRTQTAWSLADAFAARSRRPTSNATTVAPDLGDIGHIQLITPVHWQRLPACAAQDVEPLAIGLHSAILNAGAHHLEEFALRPVGPTLGRSHLPFKRSKVNAAGAAWLQWIVQAWLRS